MKKYNVCLKNNGTLIMTFLIYDKKVEKKLFTILKKNKKINVYEVVDNEKNN